MPKNNGLSSNYSCQISTTQRKAQMVLKGILRKELYLLPTPGCSDSKSESEYISSSAKILQQIKME